MLAWYDSFGNATGTLATRYGFTGRERDDATGLMYYRARFYDPKLGRFISEDPIGFEGGDVNLYGYVWNTPTKYLDPMGRDGGVSIALGSGAAVTSGGGAGIGATVSALAPPVAVGIAGAAAIYGAWRVGDYIARHPSNPLSRPWVSPEIVSGTPPFPNQSDKWSRPYAPSGPFCQPLPRTTPFERVPTMPWPDPNPDRDGCAEEISACVQLCAQAQFDPDMKNIWGGSQQACLQGCISERCKRGMRF